MLSRAHRKAVLRLKGRHATDVIEVLDDLLHRIKGAALVGGPGRSAENARAVRRDLSACRQVFGLHRLRGDLGRVELTLGVVQLSLKQGRWRKRHLSYAAAVGHAASSDGPVIWASSVDARMTQLGNSSESCFSR